MIARTDRLRLLLVDQHALLRTSLARLLVAEPDFDVVGESSTVAEALDVIKNTDVVMVLFDFDRTDADGDLISAARSTGYQGRFLAITGTSEIDRYAEALKRGAAGVFLKSEPPDRLVRAIRTVANGAIWLDQTVIQLFADRVSSQRPSARPSQASLENQEEKVLEGILAGLTNRKIGIGMGLKESSVKNILQRLFGKTGVRTRSQLVRLVVEGSLGDIRLYSARQSSG